MFRFVCFWMHLLLLLCFCFIDLPCKMSFARLMEEFSILFKTHHPPYRYNNDMDRNGNFWLLICASTFCRHAHTADCVDVVFFTRFISNKSTRCYFSQFCACRFAATLLSKRFWWAFRVCVCGVQKQPHWPHFKTYNATPTKIQHIKTFLRTFFLWFSARKEGSIFRQFTKPTRYNTHTSADFWLHFIHCCFLRWNAKINYIAAVHAPTMKFLVRRSDVNVVFCDPHVTMNENQKKCVHAHTSASKR